MVEVASGEASELRRVSTCDAQKYAGNNHVTIDCDTHLRVRCYSTSTTNETLRYGAMQHWKSCVLEVSEGPVRAFRKEGNGI